jgi:hypothetical protein
MIDRCSVVAQSTKGIAPSSLAIRWSGATGPVSVDFEVQDTQSRGVGRQRYPSLTVLG